MQKKIQASLTVSELEIWTEISCIMRKPAFRVSDQTWHKSGCKATETPIPSALDIRAV